jgi:hypothetical protein
MRAMLVQSGAIPQLASILRWELNGTVRVFRQEFTLRGAIEFRAFAPLEALPGVLSMAFLSGVHFSHQFTLHIASKH